MCEQISIFQAYKNLLRLGLPVLLAQVGNIVVSLADTMMVGAYGTNELAAAAFVNNLIVVPMVMLMGFASGITPLVGALYGAGKHYDAGQMLRVGLQLNVILSLCMAAVMIVLYFFLDKMGQDPVLLPLIRPYYLIVLGSLLIGGLFFPCMQMCNGVTDTATPMWIILGANVLNVTGNYALIFGHWGFPEWGLTGAGVSTLFGRVMSVVAIVWVVVGTKRYRPYREGLRRNVALGPQRRKMWATSWPVMIQSGIECLLWAFGAVVCGWFAKEQLAAYQVILSISQLGFMTYMSIGTAVAIRVANNMGVRNFTRMQMATRAGLHINLLLGTLASAVFLVFGRQLLHGFTSDAAVITAGMALLVPLVIYQYGDAIQITYANALRGTSHVRPLVWISIVCYAVLGAGSLLLFAQVLNLESVGVYYSFSVALFAAAWLMRRAYLRAVKEEKSLS